MSDITDWRAQNAVTDEEFKRMGELMMQYSHRNLTLRLVRLENHIDVWADAMRRTTRTMVTKG